MKWTVVTDSASDMACMKKDLNGEVGFATVPLKLRVADREFVDDEYLKVGELMDALKNHTGKSSSSAPSPAAWLEAFEAADCAVAITISSALSGSYSSAKAAVDMLAESHPDKKVLLLDSKATGGSMMLLAKRAMELAHQGVDFETMKKQMEEYNKRLEILFVLEHMDNLIKNGRVSKLEGGVATLLGIKVLGEGSPEGKISMLKKARGKMMIYDKLLSCIAEKGYVGGKVVIGHCGNKEKAEYVRNKLREQFEKASIEVVKLRGLDSFYAERGGIIVGFETFV